MCAYAYVSNLTAIDRRMCMWVERMRIHLVCASANANNAPFAFNALYLIFRLIHTPYTKNVSTIYYLPNTVTITFNLFSASVCIYGMGDLHEGLLDVCYSTHM